VWVISVRKIQNTRFELQVHLVYSKEIHRIYARQYGQSVFVPTGKPANESKDTIKLKINILYNRITSVF